MLIFCIIFLHTYAVEYKECTSSQTASTHGITSTVSFSWAFDAKGNCCTGQTGFAIKTTSVSNGFYTSSSDRYVSIADAQATACSS